MHHRDLAEKATNAALAVAVDVKDQDRIERSVACEIDLLFAHAAHVKDKTRHLATIDHLAKHGRRYSRNTGE